MEFRVQGTWVPRSSETTSPQDPTVGVGFRYLDGLAELLGGDDPVSVLTEGQGLGVRVLGLQFGVWG